ncbi:MAG: hypothetical protein OXH52_05960 [Gammaproteobacteria bacterium]|nr:hypothetical protein [Gammaproteobacteria bacterium]
MQDLSVNPFQELYLTEALEDPELYLSWFSPTVLTGQTEALFRVGNVVLSGTNGAGKTMLLRLFSPEVQAACLRLHPEQRGNPVLRQVLGIGINLVHAGISSLGKRALKPGARDNLEVWNLLLGDLINYYLTNQLISTVRFLQGRSGQPLAEYLGARVEEARVQEYSAWLGSQACWFGYLDGTDSLDGLAGAVRKRLDLIRSFVNWNIEVMPAEVLGTKTEIGKPLADARSGLETFGILPRTIPLSVTIDQYETLLHIDYREEERPEQSVGRGFCRVVNTFLSRRDPSVSFKIGVRPYSWGRERRILGSDAQLELGRDYQRVDLDELLRRGEDASSWIFPTFAGDVAARRLKATLPSVPGEYSNWLQGALEPLNAAKEVSKYRGSKRAALVPRLGSWPTPWKELLESKYDADPFGALLLEVWMLQESDRGALPDSAPADDGDAPWNREYWRKERKEALLVQIASNCRQRKLYAGWNTVLTLSGGNILIFLSLCREIWDIAQRAASKMADGPGRFSVEHQTQAIWSVSAAWVRKQEEFPGGAVRRRFVTRIGLAIRKGLIGDKKLSYPGHTGFSLTDEDLESPEAQGVREFLESAADFGALVKLRHRTKERDRKPREKFYLFPVLCPHFDIPAARTKEPYYATAGEVAGWIGSEEPVVFASGERGRRRQRRAASHPELFE